MADVIGTRLAQLIEDQNASQSSIARAIGVSQPSIGRLISGETRSTSKLLELAYALATTPEYLVGETDDPSPKAVNERRAAYASPTTESTDTVEVAEIDLRYGMGATFIDDVVDATPRSFSRAWLRNFTDSPPDELFWARGQGNSMEPEIRDGDIVLIDRRQQSLVMADLIWAFAYGDTGMIKWLRPMPDGSVEIHSSNQSVRPAKAYDGEINLVGRVVAVVKRL